MNVLVATSGALSPEPAAQLAVRIAGTDGTIFVATVIEVPRSFLDELRSEGWNPLDEGREAQGDAVISRYVEERGKPVTDPLLASLRNLGVEPQVSYLEGENVAKTITNAAQDVGADVIILGATKPIFDESSWEPVSLRVVQEGTLPVLIIPTLPREPDDQEHA